MAHSLKSDYASVDDHLYWTCMITNEVQNIALGRGLYAHNLPICAEHSLSFLQDVSFFIKK